MRNATFYEELSKSHAALQAAHLELQNTQAQLLGAQKMEAIGSLAAGIAHEINTPIQFVSDNVNFIKQGMKTLAGFAREHAEILNEIVDHPELGDRVRAVQDRWRDEDCDFTIEEIPDAVEETLEGTRRVTEIVRAMKEFAHPGQEELTSTDINRVIENTVKVSRNEWKYVAEVELDLAEDLPQIPALPGPLGQSILIMIVNSSQELAANRAIESEGKGTIKVTTRLAGENVEIRIADDGPGIPPEILPRIFDPFFTTKEVGTGSGQGLSIAQSVIVDKHNGQIWAENLDPGALMVIQIPVSQPKKADHGESEAIA
jgi:signal transduction histidine kinase